MCLFKCIPQGSVYGKLLFTFYIDSLSMCSNCNIQKYADDTVIYVHGGSMTQVANEQTNSKVRITTWLKQYYLQLNVSKKGVGFFFKSNMSSVEQDVFVSGERLLAVSCSELKCGFNVEVNFWDAPSKIPVW